MTVSGDQLKRKQEVRNLGKLYSRTPSIRHWDENDAEIPGSGVSVRVWKAGSSLQTANTHLLYTLFQRNLGPCMDPGHIITELSPQKRVVAVLQQRKEAHRGDMPSSHSSVLAGPDTNISPSPLWANLRVSSGNSLALFSTKSVPSSVGRGWFARHLVVDPAFPV